MIFQSLTVCLWLEAPLGKSPVLYMALLGISSISLYNCTKYIYIFWKCRMGLKVSKGFNRHFLPFHWALYPTHLFPIHFCPKSTGQATCLVYLSGISLENVLCQNKAAPFFPKTEIPAYGQTVAPPAIGFSNMVKMVATRLPLDIGW